jgi:hypothetical protein
MTLKATITCDAYSCFNEFEVDEPYNLSLDRELGKDWHQDPDNYETHYCPECWETAKEELEEAGENDE